MDDSIRLGRIAGIRIGLNWSMLVVFWLITWSLAEGRFPDDFPGHTGGSYWTAAAVTAVIFYLSLLAHELGHAVVARRHGVAVEGITLWLFGGVAKLRSEATDPKADLRIALVGPAVSVCLGGTFGLLALALDATGAGELVVGAAAWLALINVVLAVFNLLPAAPLDGGRVLRAVLWRRRGDQVSASVTAARAGRAFGYALIAIGLLEVAVGAAVGGLWFVFLGWFLLNAARAEEAHVLVRGALAGVRVGDVMTTNPVRAPGTLTVSEFIDRYVLGQRHAAYPVEDTNGTVAGLVTLRRLKDVTVEHRSLTRVLDIACALSEVPTAAPDEPLADLLERLSASTDGRALVFEAGLLVGIVSPSDVAGAIEVASLRSTSHAAGTPPGASAWMAPGGISA